MNRPDRPHDETVIELMRDDPAFAQQTGLSRESLYRSLSPSGNPTLKTLLALLKAMGLRLGVVRVAVP